MTVLEDKLTLVTLTARRALEAMAEVGAEFGPILHIYTPENEGGALVMLDDVPRQMGDPHLVGRSIGQMMGKDATEAFFIADTYMLSETLGSPSEAMSRHAEGVSLQELFLVGVPGVYEALSVLGMSQSGDALLVSLLYVRDGNKIEWREDEMDSLPRAGVTGAGWELLSGVLGL